MTTIVPAGVSPTGERVERVIDGVGTVVFENYGPGEWVTKKGDPAKKARRRYLLDGEEVDSVSSIVGTMDKPALLRWIEDQATRGAVQAERQGLLDGVEEDYWTDHVKSLGLGASAKRDEGAERGTVIHDALDGLTRGVIPNPEDFVDSARPWVQGSMRAWLALGIAPDDDIIASEEITAHPEYRYGGRPDLIARVDGAVTLLDYKTGKGRVYEQAHYQTRLYEMAKRVEGLVIERILIISITDDGGFQLVECEASDDDALALIHLYRSRKRINAGMADQRRIAKAAA